MRARGLVPLLLLLLLVPGVAVTLRSGKALGPDVAAQQPQLPLQQQAQRFVEEVLPAGLATTTGNLVHDVGLFLVQHVLGLVGWGATAGSIYRAVYWVTNTDCYKAGVVAAKPSAAYVTGWERHLWSAAGGVGACVERLWKNAPTSVHPPVNPYFSELADLHTLDYNLWITVVLIAAFLALARLLLKGPPDRAALRGAAIWFFAAAVGVEVGALHVRSSTFYTGLAKVCEDWLGQPTERQWFQFKCSREALTLADAGARSAFGLGVVCILASVAQAVRGYLGGAKVDQETWAEAKVQEQEQEPPPHPTLPPSPKRFIPEEKWEEEPPSRSTGARSGGGGGAEGYKEHPFCIKEAEQHQRRTIPVTTTTTAMVVFTPATPPLLPLKKDALQLPLTKRLTSPMGKGGRVIEVISLGGGAVKWRYADDLPDLIVGLPPLPDDDGGLVACGAGSVEQEDGHEEHD